MRCPDETRLDGYLYRDMSLWEDWVIRIHLLLCSECRAKLAKLQEFDLALKSIPVEEPPPGFEEDLIRMVKAWDFDPDPPQAGARVSVDEPESMPDLRGYKVRWAVGTLVFLLGSFLQYRLGSLLPGRLGGAGFLFSLHDLGALWDYIASGAWWNNLVSIAAALRTDGLASLEILGTALPSQILSVIVFGGIALVVFINQHRASRDGGEGIE